MLTFHEKNFIRLTAKLWLPFNHFTFYLSTHVALIFVLLDLLHTYNTEIIPFPSLWVGITFLFLGAVLLVLLFAFHCYFEALTGAHKNWGQFGGKQGSFKTRSFKLASLFFP